MAIIQAGFSKGEDQQTAAEAVDEDSFPKVGGCSAKDYQDQMFLQECP